MTNAIFVHLTFCSYKNKCTGMDTMVCNNKFASVIQWNILDKLDVRYVAENTLMCRA